MIHRQELDLGSSHLQDAGLEYLKRLLGLRTLTSVDGISDAGWSICRR